MTKPINVTITGADDATNPSLLGHMSIRYPFTEWGILFSVKRVGEPRYPTMRWIRQFGDRMTRVHEMRWAMHLCGAVSREQQSIEDAASTLANDFTRVQINGYEIGRLQPTKDVEASVDPRYPKRLNAKVTLKRATFILQCRSEADFSAYAKEALRLGHGACVLYDPSGGAGARGPWPDALESHGVPFGIAGGIGPDNIDEAYAAAQRLGASWIDMESGVRTDGRLDLKKVRAVLERVRALREGRA